METRINTVIKVCNRKSLKTKRPFDQHNINGHFDNSWSMSDLDKSWLNTILFLYIESRSLFPRIENMMPWNTQRITPKIMWTWRVYSVIRYPNDSQKSAEVHQKSMNLERTILTIHLKSSEIHCKLLEIYQKTFMGRV